MVAFILSFVVTVAMVASILVYANFRDPKATLSWGEANLAAAYVFLGLFLAYGVVPHQFLNWADNELGWRSDKFAVGPGGVLDLLPLTLHYEILRDIIVTVMYIVFLVIHVIVWIVWQNRGESKQAEIPTTTFGRPLVKKA